MNVEVNFMTVLLAAVASMVVGFIYYSPMLFGNKWMKLSGINPNKSQMKSMGKYYAFSFVLALITAYVLYHFIFLAETFFGMDPLMTAIITSVWAWIGFAMPVQATGEIFGHKKWGLFGLNTGYQLVSILAMGIVIALLG